VRAQREGDLSRDPLIGFGISEQVATFLLHEAFRFAYEAAAYEVAGELFADRIKSIDPEPGWTLPEIPKALTDWLANRSEIDDEGLDPVTTDRLAEAWQLSQRDAYSSGRRIPKTQKLQSLTDVGGHVINLGTCIEAVINRHLFLLRESGKLANEHYLMLDRTEVLPKLLYCFKEEIDEKKLHLSRLRYLVSLRNQAVHFRTSNADELIPTCQDLVGVLREIGSIFSLIEGEPTKEEVDHLVKGFKDKWLKR
jgi:hypothetical protein